jgi:PAS domain S-box-containing protein
MAWIPVALLLLGLAGTAVLLFLLARGDDFERRRQFERDAVDAAARFANRLDAATALLESAAVLQSVRGPATRAEFAAFARQLRPETTLRGMLGIGYAERVTDADIAALEARIRATGLSGFHVWPLPPATDRFPIVALEPATPRNRAAVGYDMFTDPVRRAAMACARDTAAPCASGPVTLVQEIDDDKQTGFLIFVPVFDDAAAARDPARPLLGFVYAPFRAGDLLTSLDEARTGRLGIELFDEAGSGRQRLARTTEPLTPAGADAITRHLRVAGRTWSMSFVPGPALSGSGRPVWQHVVLVAGALVSLLLSGIAWSQLRARAAHERASESDRRQQAARAAILESITDAFFAVDHEWRYTYMNRHALDYYGRPAEALIGQTIWDVFPASRGSTFETEFRRAVGDRVSVTFETLSPVSGKRLEVHAYPSDEGLSVYFRDVTARFEQQQRLAAHAADIARLNRDLEQRVDELRTLLEVLPVGIGMALDAEGRAIQTNRAFAELLRLPPGQNASLSAPHGERPQHFRVLLDGRELAPEELPLQLAAREGITIRDLELEIVFEDGTRKQLLEYAAPLFDRDGRPRGSVGAFIDVTARVAAEETFRTMANSAPVLVCMADTGNACVWVNDPWLRFTGRRLEQEMGEGWMEGVHPEDRERCRATIGGAFNRRQPFSVEFRLRRADGVYRWILAHGVPLRRGPVFSGYIGSCVDITDRKTAELEHTQLLQEVREANRLKDEFLATLSHELRTPLNAILGWTRMLRTQNLPPDRAARALEIVERNATVQTQLVEDILDMSRIVTGKLRLDLRSVEVTSVVSAALDAVRPAADAKGVHVQAVMNGGVPPLLADADRLQQAVWNLLTNAIKFTPRGGHVRLEVQRGDGHVEVTVSDTGIGIAAEFLPYIFDRFRQADATCTRSSTGLGLGLSLVKHVVEAHGGTVDAASRGTDQGATFRVTLPLPPAVAGPGDGAGARRGEAGRRADTEGAPPATADHPLCGVRVLAVEDEPDGLALLVMVLRSAGAEVIGESTAVGALARLDAWLPDVIVTDIGMPEMDGWELIRRVRERSADTGGQVPAAALTAYARSEDRARAKREGFQLHVSKPVDPHELVSALTSLVAAARTSDSLRPADVH